MDKPAEVTADVILDLCDAYINAPDIAIECQIKSDLKSAIAKLCEERDYWQMSFEECSEIKNDISIERDSLRKENEELREAVMKQWWYCTDDGEAGCRHCKGVVEIPEDYDMNTPPILNHEPPDCLITRMQEEK